MVTARAKSQGCVWNLFLLVFGILGAGPPPPAVLLHSYDPCAAQAVSRFVCKRARPMFRTSFLHSVSSVLAAKVILQKSKYDQCLKTLGNLSVFPQRTIIKFGAAGVCILAGFVVKYIQSIYRQQTWRILMLIFIGCVKGVSGNKENDEYFASTSGI